MNEITWYCDVCNADCEDFGGIVVSYEDTRKSKAYMDAVGLKLFDVLTPHTARWGIFCDEHHPSGAIGYGISTAIVRTFQELASWLAHLLEKDWIQFTDMYHVVHTVTYTHTFGGKYR